jgi:NitT/TauT family transport system substrate-binding protein
VQKQGGFKPQVYLLADHGYSTYSTTIEARADTIKNQPELVKRFVEASIIGWNNYLYGDRSLGDALILQENPEMDAATISQSVQLMKDLGVVDSGDSLTLGLGAMKPERVKDFFDKMVRAGLYKSGEVDLSKVATYQFVNQGVGLDLKKKLTAGK